MMRVQAKQNRELYFFRKFEAKNASYQPWFFVMGALIPNSDMEKRLRRHFTLVTQSLEFSIRCIENINHF